MTVENSYFGSKKEKWRVNQTEKGNECGALWGKRSKKRKEKCIYMQKTENDGSLSILWIMF